MTNIKLTAAGLLIAGAMAVSDSHGQETPPAPKPGHRHGTTQAMPHHGPCAAPVHISQEAERQPGGSLFEGTMANHGDGDMAHGKAKADMSKMAGAHMVHSPRRGGAFFMAPNKMNHLEAHYSDACGFNLFLYNIRTESIGVARFRAFIKVVPDSMDEPEVIRFLSPEQNGGTLSARIGDDVSRPFTIEIYVKFPEADDPELFTMHVPAMLPGGKP